MKRELQITSDGSQTIYMEELDETYHSSHGAIQEARHVFIQNGIVEFFQDNNELSIFEMGFGTGLNALLTQIHAEETKKKISYFGIEAYPVEDDLLQKINYVEQIGEVAKMPFKQIHAARWDEMISISPYFELFKIHEKIEKLSKEFDGKMDLIYYDAFGPRAQSAMWEPTILSRMYELLKDKGVLVTYCAKGQVKRDLRDLGFEVKSLPGPPGKREMTAAIKR